jgi:magnesium-transporting ATPase (P-type)
MVVKIFKAVWFLSLLVSVALLLYVYASLPADLQIGEGERSLAITRESLFYAALIFLALSNCLVFFTGRIYGSENVFFQAWFFGLISISNLFMDVALQFINVTNSAEKFDYSQIGWTIYGSLSLLILWATLFPIIQIRNRFSGKQSV